jgi:hypothetical protein
VQNDKLNLGMVIARVYADAMPKHGACGSSHMDAWLHAQYMSLTRASGDSQLRQTMMLGPTSTFRTCTAFLSYGFVGSRLRMTCISSSLFIPGRLKKELTKLLARNGIG